MQSVGCGATPSVAHLLAVEVVLWVERGDLHVAGAQGQGGHGWRTHACHGRSGHRVYGAGCRVQSAGCRVHGVGCKMQGAGCRAQDYRYRLLS